MSVHSPCFDRDAEWLGLDATGAGFFVHAELNVAVVAPAGSPRVLDEPVVLAVLVAVSDDQDSMVAVWHAISQYAGLIGVEAPIRTVNTDRKRLFGSSGLHLRRIVVGHVDLVRGHNTRVRCKRGILASLITLATVRV